MENIGIGRGFSEKSEKLKEAERVIDGVLSREELEKRLNLKKEK